MAEGGAFDHQRETVTYVTVFFLDNRLITHYIAPFELERTKVLFHSTIAVTLMAAPPQVHRRDRQRVEKKESDITAGRQHSRVGDSVPQREQRRRTPRWIT
jgi:hypothetical protein